MPALRHSGISTTASASVISALLSDVRTTKVVFFATDKTPSTGYNQASDGPATNLPLVVAVAEYNIPGFGPIDLVFDGLFLTRARHPRMTEVDQVLADACASNKARYSPIIAPFTSSMAPDAAANMLLQQVSFPLDSNSLQAYLRLF